MQSLFKLELHSKYYLSKKSRNLKVGKVGKVGNQNNYLKIHFSIPDGASIYF